MWTFIGLVVAVASICVAYVHRTYSYWSRRNVAHTPYTIPFGHVDKRKNLRQFQSVIQPSYDAFRTRATTGVPFFGMYFFHRPMAVIIDPQLIRHVLVKDFETFQERGIYNNPRGDPLSAHLFSMDGEPWRRMRSKLTPTFTSGKMKFMFPTMLAVAERFERCLDDLVEDSRDLEVKDLLARFTTDIIGTCAFGIECNSLADPNAEFRHWGREIFVKPRNGAIVSMLISSFKRVALALNAKVVRSDVSEFFLRVVDETVRMREREQIKRNDFMDLLIELRKNDDSLTIGEITAQVFIFFLAGFETSSTTMMFALYEMALNPDVQQKAREEVRAVLKRHNGELTYEALNDLHYLDQVINETLRKYPPVGTLVRSAVKDFPVPGTDHVLTKGTTVLIPAYSLQHDEQHFPDPERFDPDRFTAEAKAARDGIVWLPFGHGPRNCIGLRFGLMQTRIGLVNLLNRFEIGRSEATKVPLEFSKKTFLLNVEGGMTLKLTKIAKV